MSETSVTSQTSNGSEIAHPREVLQLDEFRQMIESYGLGGDTPEKRAHALMGMPKESVALFLSDLNARLNGSEETLIDTKTVKLGGKPTIAPEERYDLFSVVTDKIKNAPDDINPARLGDALALSTVLLHPFSDGNGRTARMVGYMFRDGMDGSDAQEDFDVLVQPRDIPRSKGEYIVNGYIPYMGEGADQSDPIQVAEYIDKVLSNDEAALYTSPYGQAELLQSNLQEATQK